MLQKLSISDKSCPFELSIHQRILKLKCKKQNIDNNHTCFLSSKSMISEGSCDTEDWSNDVKNSAFPTHEYFTFQF